MSVRQAARISRIATHHAKRYQELAGQPAALRDAAWNDLRAAIKDLPDDEASTENQRLTVLLQRRAAELRKGNR